MSILKGTKGRGIKGRDIKGRGIKGRGTTVETVGHALGVRGVKRAQFS